MSSSLRARTMSSRALCCAVAIMLALAVAPPAHAAGDEDSGAVTVHVTILPRDDGAVGPDVLAPTGLASITAFAAAAVLTAAAGAWLLAARRSTARGIPGTASGE